MPIAGSNRATRERCSDGIDNDNNGYTDRTDYSCKRANDLEVRQACQGIVGETSAEANAHDMQDNDGDGFAIVPIGIVAIIH